MTDPKKIIRMYHEEKLSHSGPEASTEPVVIRENTMTHFVPTRGYWKVTRKDLEAARGATAIEFHIDGKGSAWEDGAVRITVQSGTPEWNYLFQHIWQLDSFINKNENTNSKTVPGPLRNCMRRA